MRIIMWHQKTGLGRKIFIGWLIWASFFGNRISAQTSYFSEETFDGYVHFSLTPASLWDTCSRLASSFPFSFRSTMPQNRGDSSVLISPVYDFSSCKHVFLIFDHICKIAKNDIACIEIKEDYLGATWRKISSSCYKGSPSTYRQQQFSDYSYPEWMDDSATALPDDKWWKTECFDLSGEAAYSKIQLRFKLKKGNEGSSPFLYGWVLDNIRLYGSSDSVQPPVIRLSDPVTAGIMEGTGPFPIRFQTDGKAPWSFMAAFRSGGKFQTVFTESTGNDSAAFSIPPTRYGSHVFYTIQAIDADGDTAVLTRSFSNPFPQDGRDSSLAVIESLTSPERHTALVGRQLPVRILLRNAGIRDLDSLRIGWKYGTSGGFTLWKGELPADFCTDTLLLSIITVSAEDETLKIWVENPPGALPTHRPDTLYYAIHSCNDYLKGNYTVGIRKDFESLTEVIQSLYACGIDGNTTFLLDSGSYTDSIFLKGNIPGTENGYCIRFASASGRTGDVIWESADREYVLLLEKVQNIQFHRLCFRLGADNQAFSAVLLKDSVKHILFSHCLFQTESSEKEGIMASARGMDHICFIGNLFRNGRTGISLQGSNWSDNRNILVDSNRFEGQSGHGLSLYCCDFLHIRSNSFQSQEKSDNDNRYYEAAYLYGCQGKDISGNSFLMRCGRYALFIGAVRPDSVHRLKICNNEIRSVSSYSSAGIMMSSACSRLLMAHNSILLTGMYGSPCVNISGLSDSIEWRNNLFVHCGKGGNGSIWAFTNPILQYLPSHTFECNHYYAPLGGLLQDGRTLNLDEWKSLSGQDRQSTWGNPHFNDTARNLELMEADPICLSLPEITDDLKGGERRTALTTKGCYHTIGNREWDASPFRILSPAENIRSDSICLSISLANVGRNAFSSIRVFYGTGGTLQQKDFRISTIFPGDTLPLDIAKIPICQGTDVLNILTALPNDSIDNYKGNDTISLRIYRCDSSLNGTYSIGNRDADFSSLEEAVQRMEHCGISGPVTFLLQSGTYSMHSEIRGFFPGSSPTNRIRFVSLADHADSVLLIASPNGNEYSSSICLENTGHLDFENLTFVGDTSAKTIFSLAVECKDSCKDIVFRNCRFVFESSSQHGLYSGIYASDCVGDSICIYENTFVSGNYGIFLQGISLNAGFRNLQIERNTFIRQKDCSIFLKFADFGNISYNHGENISLSGCRGDCMDANCFYAVNKSQTAYFQEVSPRKSGSELLVTNNVFSCETNDTHMALQIQSYCQQIGFYHNHFHVCGNGQGNTLYLWELASVKQIRFLYNIATNFSLNSDANDNLCIYASSLESPSAYTFDYNHYFSIGKCMFYCHTAFEDLDKWQIISQQDIHSTAGRLDLTDSLTLLQPLRGTFLECIRKKEVTNDVYGKERKLLSWKGAYPPVSVPHNTCLFDVNHLTEKNINGQNTDLCIGIGNYGDSALKNAHICWIINGIRQNDAHWTGHLMKGDTAHFLLGRLHTDTALDILVYLLDDEEIDNEKNDDSLRFTIVPCATSYAGDYVVGPDGDFHSPEEALYALSRCGITDNVTLKLATGRYAPLVFNRRIPGCGPEHRITLTPYSGKTGDVIFSSDSSSAQDIIRCIGTSHLTLDHLQIEASATHVDAAGIRFLFHCEDIGIQHCLFQMRSSSQTAIIQTSGWGIHDIQILDNTINGGKCGIQLQGTSTDRDSNITISYNRLNGLTDYGIYLQQACFHEINHNLILQENKSGSGFYGIYMNTVTGNRIEANRITASRGFYGIYLSNTSGQNHRLCIANNEIHLQVPSSNCGIYLYNGCGHLDIAHNSVLLQGKGMGKCIYTAFSIPDVQLKNNHLINLSGKTDDEQNYVLYMYGGNGFNGWDADYNTYYSRGKNLHYLGKNIGSLSEWQNITQKDIHSLSTAPEYRNTDQSLKLKDAPLPKCPKLPEVPLDKEGMERGDSTYIGAYQFLSEHATDWNLYALTSPCNNEENCFPYSQPIRIQLRNEGRDTIDFDRFPLQIHLRIRGCMTFDTVCTLSQGQLFPMQSEEIVLLEECILWESGIYQFTIWSMDASDAIRANDTLRAIYSVHRTQLPFASNGLGIDDIVDFQQLQGKIQWFVDTSHENIAPKYGKQRLCFPSGSDRGSVGRMIFHPMDLTGLQHPTLSIWYAQEPYHKMESDQLKVMISTDGGNTYSCLRTIPRYNAQCSGSEWIRFDMDLSAYASSCTHLALDGISYGGNHLYIDSICIFGNSYLQIKNILHPSTVKNCLFDAQGLWYCLQNPSAQHMEADSVCLETALEGQNYRSFLVHGDMEAYQRWIVCIDSHFVWEPNRDYLFDITLHTLGNGHKDSTSIHISMCTDLNLCKLSSDTCVYRGEPFLPRVTIWNNGNTDICNAPIEIYLNDSLTASETLPLIRAGNSLDYIFSELQYAPDIPESRFEMNVRLPLECDAILEDNILFAEICLTQEDDSLSLPSFSERKELRLFPNPATENIRLQIRSEKDEEVQIGIFNVQGQQILSGKMNCKPGKNEMNIPLSGWAKGFYICHIRFEDRTDVEKFILE